MEVIELKPFGYCYGVKEALKIIEEVKDKHQDKNVYVFGMLVHNNDVVKHLESKNVITIDTTKVNKLERLEKFTSDDVDGNEYTLYGKVTVMDQYNDSYRGNFSVVLSYNEASDSFTKKSVDIETPTEK